MSLKYNPLPESEIEPEEAFNSVPLSESELESFFWFDLGLSQWIAFELNSSSRVDSDTYSISFFTYISSTWSDAINVELVTSLSNMSLSSQPFMLTSPSEHDSFQVLLLRTSYIK